MALEEHDREDLLRDGQMMPSRGACSIADVTVVVGFRRRGQLSLYCGADPVFQFNADQQLRRVFFQGTRFSAERGNLTELSRETRGGRVQFVSKVIEPEMQAIILSSASDWLDKLRVAVRSTADWRVIEDNTDPFRSRLLQWLDDISEPQIADTPNA